MTHDCLTPDERLALDHFNTQHSHAADGRFIVLLPEVKQIGESPSEDFSPLNICSIRRDTSKNLNLSWTSTSKQGMLNLFLRTHGVFYLPVHAVRKESSTKTKVWAVFDASAKSLTGVSLNDILLVRATVTSPDVLLFSIPPHRSNYTDISRMYRAVALDQSDKDLHRFVWRKDPSEPLKDNRVTRVTFGVSVSSFIANMCVKQNAINHASKYPFAKKVVGESFYVNDGLTQADTVDEAVELHNQLQSLFNEGGFLLHKWNSSDPVVLQHIKPELRDLKPVHPMPDSLE